jgi:hypothetical protein
MADESESTSSEEKPCSNPYGVAGDIHREEDGRRINIYKCSPYGNWVHVGSELKD